MAPRLQGCLHANETPPRADLRRAPAPPPHPVTGYEGGKPTRRASWQRPARGEGEPSQRPASPPFGKWAGRRDPLGTPATNAGRECGSGRRGVPREPGGLVPLVLSVGGAELSVQGPGGGTGAALSWRPLRAQPPRVARGVDGARAAGLPRAHPEPAQRRLSRTRRTLPRPGGGSATGGGCARVRVSGRGSVTRGPSGAERPRPQVSSARGGRSVPTGPGQRAEARPVPPASAAAGWGPGPRAWSGERRLGCHGAVTVSPEATSCGGFKIGPQRGESEGLLPRGLGRGFWDPDAGHRGLPCSLVTRGGRGGGQRPRHEEVPGRPP